MLAECPLDRLEQEATVVEAGDHHRDVAVAGHGPARRVAPTRIAPRWRRRRNKRAEPRTVSRSDSELIRWMSIQDANSAGFIHGGVVMRMCDEVAGIAAIRHSGCRVVTAGMDRMTFLCRCYVGELLRCIASVNAAWRTSMEVGVRVEAENAVTGEVRHTSTAYLTMVAVDEHGQPVPVPPLEVEGPTEERRQREAETRRRNRLTEREEILRARQAARRLGGLTPPTCPAVPLLSFPCPWP